MELVLPALLPKTLHSNYFWVKIAHLNLLETAHLKFNKDETDLNFFVHNVVVHI